MTNEPDKNFPKQKYQWPWFVLAAVLLFVLLAIIWMTFAVNREKEERDYNTPPPNNSTNH